MQPARQRRITIELTDEENLAFWAQIPAAADADPNVCWPWIGSLHDNGYGNFLGLGAHRVAFAILVQQPGRAYVLHSCHNKPCCNPAHLRLGTHRDNMDDRRRAGRTAKGQPGRPGKGSRNILTAEQADIIRDSGKTASALSKEFKVGKQQIYSIWEGRSWRK